jgi:hypothetical protein
VRHREVGGHFGEWWKLLEWKVRATFRTGLLGELRLRDGEAHDGEAHGSERAREWHAVIALTEHECRQHEVARRIWQESNADLRANDSKDEQRSFRQKTICFLRCALDSRTRARR